MPELSQVVQAIEEPRGELRAEALPLGIGTTSRVNSQSTHSSEGCGRLESGGRSVLASFLSDLVAANLWDEDFLRRSAYTRNILKQGCAGNTEVWRMLHLCADCVLLDAGMLVLSRKADSRVICQEMTWHRSIRSRLEYGDWIAQPHRSHAP